MSGLPDSEALTIDLVRSTTSWSAFTLIPANAVTQWLPFHLVTVLPGSDDADYWRDVVSVEVQSWAADRPTARDGAEAVRSGLHAAWLAQQPRAAGLLSSYRCHAKPRRLPVPDDPVGVVRFRALYELTLRSI